MRLGEHQGFWKAENIEHRVSKSVAGSGNQPKQRTPRRNHSGHLRSRLQEIGKL